MSNEAARPHRGQKCSGRRLCDNTKVKFGLQKWASQLYKLVGTPERRALLGPYKSATAPAPPALLNPQPNNAQTLIDFVAAIATKEDRREVEKMKIGVARSAGLFMSGTLNEKTGKVCFPGHA